MECGEQLIEQRLQTAFEGTQQERDEYREGEDALARKGFVAGAMFGNEFGIV
jgi:hypothetical protein